MLNKRLLVISAIILFVINFAFAQSVEDNYGEFLHYTRIGRLELAKGYAEQLLGQEPEPTKMLELANENQQGYELLLRVSDTTEDKELKKLVDEILQLIEKGRFIKRTSPKIIAQEIRRLSTTQRGKLNAVERLKNSGEYAIPFMIDALADPLRKDEFANIVWALPKIGRDAIRPLVAALQTDNVGVKAEIIEALGEIGYPQSLPYLKYVVENEKSDMLIKKATESIMQINPDALKKDSALLFYELGDKYYYHTESLQPKLDADFANIWFWDEQDRTLFRREVDIAYFNELMAMRTCEWSLRADVEFGKAIGLWTASFFKAEETGIQMPEYFGQGHGSAYVYATTAGPEYIHQALARSIGDENDFITLGCVESLAATAGEASLFYSLGVAQPLMQAVKYDNVAVRYSASIAIAKAGPANRFAERHLVVKELANALKSSNGDAKLNNKWSDIPYSLRAARVINRLAVTGNEVLNLNEILESIIDSTYNENDEIKMLACDTLAYFEHPEAQQAIADMAFNEEFTQQMKIDSFSCLISSAKQNGNMLEDEKINKIYELLSSKTADPQLKDAAASCYGALNLPSEKVKDLILDQSKK